MLDVSWAMFDEPDVTFRVNSREREAWGYPTPMANNNGWGHAPLSHSTRCRVVGYIPFFSLPPTHAPRRDLQPLSAACSPWTIVVIRFTKHDQGMSSTPIPQSNPLTNVHKSDFVATHHYAWAVNPHSTERLANGATGASDSSHSTSGATESQSRLTST